MLPEDAEYLFRSREHWVILVVLESLEDLKKTGLVDGGRTLTDRGRAREMIQYGREVLNYEEPSKEEINSAMAALN